jgi:outer membrane protein assembly factor BamB/serine/threonine protein kinase
MADRVGQQLGNYRLIRLLGKGGFAEVYLGEHVYLETQAAIKVLLTQLAFQDMEPFRLEAKRVAHLEHPHIVRVLEFGVDGSTPYLVMSYAPNGTLRERHLKGVALPLPTILAYVKQAAEALQYAHDEHFVHRDVKPENLLVGRRQEILLSDFGIALLTQTSRSQSMQDVAGTASYMAPEQFQGKPRPASDQYSLGVVVYEWLSGDRPFHGSFTEIASQHLFVPPPPLHARMSDIPVAVEHVVMTALAKDPQQRFPSVQAFATAFAEACQETHPYTIEAETLPETVKAVPSETPFSPIFLPATELASPGKVQQLPISSESKTTLTVSTPSTTNAGSIAPPQRGFSRSKAAFLVVLVLLLVGSASFVYLNMSNNNGVIGQVTTPVRAGSDTTRIGTSTTAEPEPVTTATISADLYNSATTANGIMFGFDAQHSHYNPYEKVLSRSNINELVNVWTYHIERDAFYIIPSSPVIANGIVYIGSQDHSFYALDANSGRKIWSYLTGGPIISTPAVVNGVVYFGSLDHSMYALDARTGRRIWNFLTGQGVRSSPVVVNGVIYFGSIDGSLYVLNARTGRLVWKFQTQDQVWSSAAVANGVVYFGSFDHSLYALDARTGKKRWSYLTGSYILGSPAVANGVVYIGSEDHKVYAVDAQTGGMLWSYTTGNDVDSSPAIVNGIVYVGSRDSWLYALDAASGKVRWSYPSANSIFSPPTIANGLVYFGSDDHSFYSLNAQSGSKLWSYSTGGNIVSSPAIANGMVYIGSDDNMLYAFKIPTALIGNREPIT